MEPMDALEALLWAGAARWASLQSADPWGRGSGHRRDSRRSSRRTAIGPSPSRLATERKATLKPPTPTPRQRMGARDHRGVAGHRRPDWQPGHSNQSSCAGLVVHRASSRPRRVSPTKAVSVGWPISHAPPTADGYVMSPGWTARSRRTPTPAVWRSFVSILQACSKIIFDDATEPFASADLLTLSGALVVEDVARSHMVFLAGHPNHPGSLGECSKAVVAAGPASWVLG
jgi:hypothetical protein